MKARWRRFWWAVAIIAAVMGGVSLSYVLATNSKRGRAWLLGVMQRRATAVFGGRASIKVGALYDIGMNSIVAGDVSLLDTAGVPVVHADSLVGTVDLMGVLFDKAIHIRSLSLRGVRVDLRQDFKGPWNIAHIISGDTTKALPNAKPGYANNIRIDALMLRDVDITTIAPWSPHPIFKGSARDSVIAARDSLHDIVRVSGGLLERRHIVLTRVVAHDAVMAEPTHKPSSMEIDTLRGTISDPPITIVDAAGTIHWTGDSLRLLLPKVQLPASTGSAEGTVSWNQKGPLRYDVNIKAQAGLSDLGWIWDVLPTTGNGTANVRMHTLADANDAEYVLTKLDVRAMGSHVTGDISVTTRPADLLLHHVDLAFVPMQSDLLRRLSYGAVPETVRGSVDGRLVALKGGPLKAFVIDQLNARFTDARIAGAVSTIALNGVFGFGAQPTAQNLVVQNMRLDLRSAKALVDSLPAIDGTLVGSMRVPSANLAGATVKNLALVWTDGAGNRSSLKGDARIGFTGKNPRLETTLQLDPISMRALARIDTTLGVRSDISGTVHTTGTLEALTWDAKLGATGGGFFDLRGVASVVGANWHVAAAGTVDALNAKTWVGTAETPETAISGKLRLDASGTRAKDGTLTLAAAVGDVSLQQSAASNRPAFDLIASAALTEQQLKIDSATAHLGGVTFDAHGALARSGTNADTLQVSARADTLAQVHGELTRLAAMIEPVDSASAASLRSLAADTLTGEASLSGFLLGSLDDFSATIALGAREAQVGSIKLERLFGSVRAEHLRTKPTFEGAATADGVDGVGAIRISSAEFKVQQASPDSGRLSVDVSSRSDAHLVMRGAYARAGELFDLALDSLQFQYDSVKWNNLAPIHVRSDARGLRIDSLEVRSNQRGVLAITADVPMNGDIRAVLRLDRFPIGEATTFAMGTTPFDGTLTGDALLTGTRDAPLLTWKMHADSLGLNGTFLPQISTDGNYADRRLVARARTADTLGGALHAEARVPIDLALHAMDKRTLSDAVDAEIVADSLRLQALGFVIDGVSNARGIVAGRLAISGTMDRPVATGSMALDQFSASVNSLGITPTEGRLVLRAAQDSLILESFRVRSGGVGDTLSATGAMRFAANEPATVRAQILANNVELSHQRNGTDLNLSGNVDVSGALKRPDLSGRLYVPTANLVFDPLGASKALDLTSDASRELLGLEEVPVAASAAQSFSQLGRYLSVSNSRIDLGNEVWVQTPEAKVKVAGGLAITMHGETLALEGEITANRGQYRLDLGVVNRSFAIDSGSVRFYGTDAIAPTLDISATNVVRVSTGGEIPVRVHIGGTIDRPVITLSSSDPLFASAPESEIISLLIFGAPTFALDGPSQDRVKAVTGLLLPSVGGAFEGALQRLLPVFNTVQVNTAGGQAKDDLSALSLLDNLSITAGKQVGDRAFLRFNTGICRGGGQAGTTPWFGISAEYRLARGLSAQVGVEPGNASCTRLGGDPIFRMQFGFDVFREWIF